MAKVLIVEDDLGLAQMIAELMKHEHHTVEMVHDGTEGLNRLLCCEYDVAILDWELPGTVGVDIVKNYRQQGGSIGIIMLTGKSKIEEKETGFDVGADDYLTKPFNVRELAVRVRALLKRSREVAPTLLTVGDLQLDLAKFRVTRGGAEVPLQPKEFALLEFFMRHPDETFSADILLSRVWHSESEATGEAVRTAIMRLRRKIDKAEGESVIESIPRIGYRLRSK